MYEKLTAIISDCEVPKEVQYHLHVLMDCMNMARPWPQLVAKNNINKAYGCMNCNNFLNSYISKA